MFDQGEQQQFEIAVAEHAAAAAATAASTQTVPVSEGMAAALTERATAGMVFVAATLKLVIRIIIPEGPMGVLMPAVAHGAEKHVISVHTLLLRYIVASDLTIYRNYIFKQVPPRLPVAEDVMALRPSA
ncbi:hypothetical protein [Dyella silvatica]|uniref:hypothetical protein n=1 Tax=Dyella silvatica TaxID=2992128 RepID=UPI0022549664|nr:hypothetical protein [Dyella silvatica]